ncbi:branched-chain amino acid transport system II carrier protein [Bacillus cytotoxicus]
MQGLFVALALFLIYLALAYLGASSVSLGMGENGGVILTNIVHHLFGEYGTLLLGVAITAKMFNNICWNRCDGAESSFSKLLPKFPYQTVVFIFCALAFMVANLGLTQLIALALPILITLYPIGIVLIILSLVENYIRIPLAMYVGGMIGAFAISLFDGLHNANIEIATLAPILEKIPLYSVGMGWLIPGIIGMFVGYVVSMFQKRAVVIEE